MQRSEPCRKGAPGPEELRVAVEHAIETKSRRGIGGASHHMLHVVLVRLQAPLSVAQLTACSQAAPY
eukprot:6206366-Pleurochrysis_carterae.AAC.2